MGPDSQGPPGSASEGGQGGRRDEHCSQACRLPYTPRLLKEVFHFPSLRQQTWNDCLKPFKLKKKKDIRSGGVGGKAPGTGQLVSVTSLF